jgi:hypothetical protein
MGRMAFKEMDWRMVFWEVLCGDLLAGIAVLGLALPLLAVDAKVGKEYYITIQSEQTNQYKAPAVRQRLVRWFSTCLTLRKQESIMSKSTT